MAIDRVESDSLANDVEKAVREKPYKRYLEAELGLRNHWYPALFSHEVQEGKTKGETILGERLYFKRVDGKVYCIEDRCAHRGSQFSLRPESYTKNTITCWFHGFCYDVRNGKLVSVLSEPNSSVVNKISVRSYPVFEKHHLVFVFIGDMDPPPPIEEDLQPNFWHPDFYVRPLAKNTIKCNWRMACENGFDQGHHYLHRQWPWATRYGIQPMGTSLRSKDEVQVVDKPGEPKALLVHGTLTSWVGEVEGVKVAAVGVDPDNPPKRDWEYGENFGCYLPCGLDVPNFPGPGFHHMEWYVPIDEDHHHYIQIQYVFAKTEEQRREFDTAVDEHLSRAVWTNDPKADPLSAGPNPAGFTNNDAFGREGVHHAYANENWWYREHLYKPDYSIIQWRMLVHNHARGIQKRGDFERMDED